LGCYGGNTLTPNIDRLAADGMRFEKFYTSTPVCTPSRYNYLTGHYAGKCASEPFRSEFPENAPYNIQWNVHAKDAEECLGGILNRAGYRTGYVGKMHCGLPPDDLNIRWRQEPGDKNKPLPADGDPYDPAFNRLLRENQQRMVDEMHRIGFDYAAALNWENVDLNPSPKMRLHNPEWVVKAAHDFLEQQSGAQPFFLYVSTTMIHGPDHRESLAGDPRITPGGLLDAPLEGIMPPRHTVEERIRAAGLPYDHNQAGALWLDDAVGSVVDKAKELGLLENTLVIHQTDHNVLAKGSCCERGVHIPMAVRWDGVVEPSSVCRQMAQNIDFLPTLMELAGIKKTPDRVIDGTSFLPLLKGADRPVHEDLYFEYGVQRAVSDGKWKYIALRYTPEQIEQMRNGKVDRILGTMGNLHDFRVGVYYQPNWYDPDQLYDLESDPTEQNNLAADPAFAGVLKTMQAKLEKYLVQFDHPFSLELDPFYQSETFKKLVGDARRQPLSPWTLNERRPWRKGEMII
jgi:arylsulfatase A-like enzyme